METYGKILLIAIPAFLLLVLLEMAYAYHRERKAMRTNDVISSLLSGVTNITKDVLGLSVVIYSYSWMVHHWALTHIQPAGITYVAAFLVLDFSGYCVHRIQHEYNFFWNGHLIHHSSEEFNLACALRQSISGFANIFVIFLLPAALLGVPEQVIAVVAPLHLFAQFWYHTTFIKKMGIFEKIIVTPSLHRVHHAINPEYLDKNYSQIFIFWDRLFGTYQKELAGTPPVYGITRPVQTWNPVKINFLHIGLLLKDAWRTRSWRDKCRIWLMPTGWRPADVRERYPVYKIADVYQFEKYDPPLTTNTKTWLWVQLAVLLFFICFLFGNIAAIRSPGIFYYGLFIFLFVYALAELMDGNRHAWIWEMLKALCGAGLLYAYQDWFILKSYFPGGWLFVAGYLLFSFLITCYLSKKH
ncbi:sterol desaturase family protein [Niabella drilacis]|uniref:Sterol desaturase/sphingolipid hydroxylase, fatty acid hydroxylase superfamily n=1 Tax=Niabella drilacis (strain DSM 25811 / CCM 8410 / CCUG 62505 / LMG 26954 / E90) TaxID=1285928 RepID=A0A1G6I592_NIADE|nr:sterol desaturase family protein [Niabella drilacis]SDC01664.1 Sterol desaturase/sphingolipid hydroxylase, fatty acid hydroxylase superfamily [Niabella drilacis]